MPNTYNLLKVAGSLLGYRHTEESHILMSKPKSAKIRAKLSEALTNNPMFENFHSEESLAKISGENHPLFG